MSENNNSFEAAADELKRLKKENVKLERRINELEHVVATYEQNAIFQNNIYKMIKQQKEEHDISLNLIFEYTPDTIVIMDTNQKFVRGTKNALARIGIDIGDLHEKSYREFIGNIVSQDMMERTVWALQSVIDTGEPQKYDNYEIIINGVKGIFEVCIIPLKNEEKEVIGVMLTLHDVTDLTKALDRAERSSKAKSSFLAKMSHEIRTPMNAIIGMSELVLREELPPNVRKNVLTIKQAGANLVTIINDILDFSKIESGMMELATVNYSLAAMLNEVTSIIRMRILNKPILFAVNVDCNIPNSLFGDELRVKQMLLNLLSNSCKYCEKGFVKLSVSYMDIDEETVSVVFKVSDSGIGIKQEDIGKLFGDFVQLGEMEKYKGIEGTGLGLAITRSFCRAMNGDITVESEYGKGSEFKLTIPQRFDANADFIGFAQIDDPEISALIYETREVFSSSLSESMANLGVKHKIVSNHSLFLEEIENKDYAFFFVSSFLYDSARKTLKKLGSGAKTVLISEFGEEIIETETAQTMFMPAHAADLADIFNRRDKGEERLAKKHSARFIAPTANVLAVDDITTNLVVLEGLLAPYKMNVISCKSGKEAIELARDHDFDIIFMDHMMPEMDGIEATIKIRELAKDEIRRERTAENGDYYANIPVIALTANAVAGMKEMFLKNGFQDFLAKPIDITMLDYVIDKWISKDKREPFVEVVSPEAEDVADANSPAFKIEGIDVETGIYMTGGSAKNYLKTLNIFREDGLEKISVLRYCLENDELHLYATHIHALKSASASIGAAKVSHMARSLETAAKNNDKKFIEKNNERFIDELILLLESIKLAVAAARKSGKRSGKIDSEVILDEAVKLKTALELLNMEAINSAISALREEAAGEMEAVVDDIVGSILICEYDKALEITDKLFEMI